MSNPYPPHRPAALLGAAAFAAALATPAAAATWPLPPAGEDLVGEMETVLATPDDTLVEIAARYRYGYDNLRAANPSVDAWLPREGSQVVLPGRHILPAAPRQGIVVNTAEMRIYYFPPGQGGRPEVVETFPVAIGRGDWNTPLVTTRITSKVANPAWYPPESIRREHAAQGDPLPRVVPAGPDNPLGKYALRLSIPSYLIHGTNKLYGIGMQVTHGCIRMYPEDIEALYKQVPVNTPVHIVNQRFKAGWHQGVLYVEVHTPLEETPEHERASKQALIDAIAAATRDRPDYPVDWMAVQVAAAEARGMPVPAGPILASPAIAEQGAPLAP
jgi:L,D-transpeptidase ErfK/SrfK